MIKTRRLQASLTCTAALLLATACQTTGTTRVGAIGPAGPQGAQGAPGAPGPAGTDGESGTNGADGSSGTFTGASTLSVGGLIGPDGLAGTGLLANTGDPNSQPALMSKLLVESGETVNAVLPSTLQITSLVDEALPGSTPIVGTVVGVIESTGQALIQTGEGDAYLVDGLLAAPGDLIAASIGESYPLGSAEADPFIGASLLSPSQDTGEFATIGFGSDGELLTLSDNGGAIDTLIAPGVDTLGSITAIAEGSDISGPIAGAIESVSFVTEGDPIAAISGDGGVLSGALSLTEGGDLGGVTDVLSPDTGGLLDGAVETLTGEDGLVGGTLGGLTGGDGGATDGLLDGATDTLLGGATDTLLNDDAEGGLLGGLLSGDGN